MEPRPRANVVSSVGRDVIRRISKSPGICRDVSQTVRATTKGAEGGNGFPNLDVREPGQDTTDGTPEQARWFIEDFYMDTPAFTHPTLGLYRAVGARRGVRLSKLPRLPGNTVGAMSKGHFQTRVLEDGRQLGGVFVIMPCGALANRYLSQAVGDYPDPEAVVSALEDAVKRPR